MGTACPRVYRWDEMGLYDIPATLEYILRTTGRQKLIYIGHSMGNSNFLSCQLMRIDRTRTELSIEIRLAHPLRCLVQYLTGTTMFWVAMETHPELNDKIELMVLN